MGSNVIQSYALGIGRRLRRNADVLLLCIGVIYLVFLLQRRSKVPEPEVKAEELPEGVVPEGQGEAQQRLPVALVIGAPKCGTRGLLHFLKLHPLIKSADGQANFFNKGVNYMRGVEWYRKRMPYTTSEVLTIERSPGYFTETESAKRVKEMNPNMKMILMLRDPTIRLISDYAQLRANHRAQNMKPPEFETLVFDRLSGLVNTDSMGVKISMYHTHLKKWLDVFSMKNFLIIDGDNFIKDPLPELQKVETFLGIPHAIMDAQLKLNETSGYFCSVDKAGVHCLEHTKGWESPQVDARTLRALQMFFRFHNDKLFKLTNHTYQWS